MGQEGLELPLCQRICRLNFCFMKSFLKKGYGFADLILLPFTRQKEHRQAAIKLYSDGILMT